MKITIFTSNQPRHINLINSLSKVSKKCFAIVEGKTIFPGRVKDFFHKSLLMEKYFKEVDRAEKFFFGDSKFILDGVNTKFIKHGDLNHLKKSDISDALKSDIYVVFGSSFIKGWLLDFLIKNKTINMHMGISPYYRGSSCNFWAIFDDNPHLVGSTIHLLSKGLDSGKILYHALPSKKFNDSYEYTMSSVKSAHASLAKRLKNGSIFKYKPIKQNFSFQIRYTKKVNFNDNILRKFFKKKINKKNIKSSLMKKFDKRLFILPHII